MIWANKTFDPEKAEVLYLFLETNQKTSTLMIDQHRLDPENKELTDDLLVFLEKVV